MDFINKKKRYSGVLLVILLFIINGSLLYAKGQTAWLISGSGVKKSTFSGRVFDIEAREPLSDFDVFLSENPSHKENFKNGKFEFEGILPGKDGLIEVHLRIESPDYTYCEKSVMVIPGQNVNVGDLFLVPLDPASVMIGPSGGSYQSSKGDVEIMVPPGALDEDKEFRSARFHFAQALPAPLPRSSQFTYCVDLHPNGVDFNTSVTIRVKNDRGFPAGSKIPVGVYYEDIHQWLPDGMARVSDDGQWVEYGIEHFSVCDINHPPPPPPKPEDEDEEEEDEEDENEDEDDDEDCEDEDTGHSRISKRYGVLRQEIPLFTYQCGDDLKSFTLEYCSTTAKPSCVTGLRDFHKEAPDERNPVRRKFTVQVNGKRKSAYYDQTEGHSYFSYLLDCRDDETGAWWESGVYNGVMEIAHHYPVEFYTADYFGGPPIEPTGVTSDETNPEIRYRRYPLNLEVLNLRESPFGAGWMPKGLQTIISKPDSSILLCEGTKKEALAEVGKIYEMAGTGSLPGGPFVPPLDGSSARDAVLDEIVASTSNSKGEVFLLMWEYYYNKMWVFKIDLEGRIWHIGGGGQDYPGYTEPTPAKDIFLSNPSDIECDKAGNIYCLSMANDLVKIDPEGMAISIDIPYGSCTAIHFNQEGRLFLASPTRIWELFLDRQDEDEPFEMIFGSGYQVEAPEAHGTNADLVKAGYISDLVLDSGGNIYFSDAEYGQIYRIDAETNIFEIFAGKKHQEGEPVYFSNFEGPARSSDLAYPWRLTIDPNDILYFIDQAYNAVGRITRDGYIERIAGTSRPGVKHNGASARHYKFTKLTNANFNHDYTSFFLADGEEGYKFFRMDLVPNRKPLDYLDWSDPDSQVWPVTGGFERRYKNGRKCLFNTSGKIISDQDKHGLATTYHYNSSGRLETIRDHWGDEITVQFNVDGMAESVMSPWGAVWNLNYDLEGNLITVFNPDGSSWQFEYDGESLMTSKTPPGRGKTIYAYDKNSRISSVDSPGSGTLSLTAGALGGSMNDAPEQVYPDELETLESSYPTTNAIVNELGITWQSINNSRGLQVVKIDPLGNQTIREWNGQCSLPEKITLPEGNVFQWSYDRKGNRVKDILPRGGEIIYEYNENDNVTKIKYPRRFDHYYNTYTSFFMDYNTSGMLTAAYWNNPYDKYYEHSMTYNQEGLLKTITNPRNFTQEFFYDDKGRVSKYMDYNGKEYNYKRNDQGNIIETSSQAGVIGEFSYDNMGRLSSTKDALGRPVTISYGPDGTPQSITSYNGRQMEVFRNERGRITGYQFNKTTPATPPSGKQAKQSVISEIRYDLDAAGRVVKEIDPRGNPTEYEYDNAGRVTGVILPEGGKYQFLYNGNGDITGFTNPVGNRMTFDWDADRNVSGITFHDNSKVEILHNHSRQFEKKSGPDGLEVSYSYDDKIGNPTKVQHTLSDNKRIQMYYDDAGDIRSVYTVYGSYEYQRDGNGRIIYMKRKLTVYGDFEADFVYDCCGRIQSVTDKRAGETYSYDYDPAGRLVTFTDDVGNTVGLSYNYHQDNPQRIDYPGDVYSEFEYDVMDRMTSMIVKNGTGETLFSGEYEYDAAGNCTRMVRDGEERIYTYDRNNRLTNVNSGGINTETYTYDAAGNRLTGPVDEVYEYDEYGRLARVGNRRYEYNGLGHVSDIITSDVSYQMEYTGMEQLSKVTLSDGSAYEYYYDAYGKRCFWKKGWTDEKYIIDATWLWGEYDFGWLSKSLLNPVTGEVLLYKDASEQRNFVHHDANRRPVLITDINGQIVWKADYNSFGEAVIDPVSTIEYNRRLPGQIFDEETGLHYNYHRYYDPMLGRYLQMDPLLTHDEINYRRLFRTDPYVYASNNPLTQYDEIGLCDECDDCPSGTWHGRAIGVDGGAILGINTFQVEMSCSGSPSRVVRNWVSCFKFGLFAGGGISVSGVEIVGCNGLDARSNLSGVSWFAELSAGPLGVGGGADIYDSRNFSGGGAGGAGLDAGAGLQFCNVID